MSEDLSVDSMMTELCLYLKSKARNLPYPNRSLIFKLDNKTNLKIVDSEKKAFEVEEFFLETFRETFSDPKYKYVKITGWQFEIELQQKKCKRIVLNADQIVFIANKNTKYELKDVAFRTVIVNKQQIQEFSKQSIGFIRRLIKLHILFFSLISFVKRPNEFKIQRLANVAEEQTVEEHPMEYLTTQGRKTIERLKSFITRQDVFDFLVRQQLSSACENQLRTIVMTQATEPKKKKVKAQ